MECSGPRPSFKAKTVRWIAAAVFGLSVPCALRAQPEWSPPQPACLYSAELPAGSTGTLCIREASYNRDLCVAIETLALANHLPPDYLARLIWRESAFRSGAISPKGAQGIAQFMPGTAKLRRLRNSFDVLEALAKSAEYLDELRNRFGNLGLAAAAYNAGEARVADFLTSGRLPGETRNYVIAITAHSVEEWTTHPPDVATPDLEQGKAFVDACAALGDSRKLKEDVVLPQGVWAPWGAQLAEHMQGAAARRLFLAAVGKLPAPLNAEQPLLLRIRNADFGFRRRYAARIGRQTRDEAEDVCSEVRKHGASCFVFKN